jgi:hypothetical protein
MRARVRAWSSAASRMKAQLDLDLAADQGAPVADWEAHPRTGTVIALLAGAAIILSYLFSYCVMNALAASDVITRWTSDHDPRPKVFLIAFVVLSALFAAIGLIARTVSKRQMSKIDEMESAQNEITSSTQF